MIDTETYLQLNPGRCQNFSPLGPSESSQHATKKEANNCTEEADLDYDSDESSIKETPTVIDSSASPERLTDEQCLIASATVPGFAFGEKKWGELCSIKIYNQINRITNMLNK